MNGFGNARSSLDLLLMVEIFFVDASSHITSEPERHALAHRSRHQTAVVDVTPHEEDGARKDDANPCLVPSASFRCIASAASRQWHRAAHARAVALALAVI